MSDAVMLTRKQVCERYAISKDLIYSGIRAGTFPKPVKVGAQAVRWRVRDLKEWEDQAPAADLAEADAE